jgi:hypothetical protein
MKPRLDQFIGFKTDAELRDRITAAAAREKRTVANLLRVITEEYVNHVERQAAARQ